MVAYDKKVRTMHLILASLITLVYSRVLWWMLVFPILHLAMLWHNGLGEVLLIDCW